MFVVDIGVSNDYGWSDSKPANQAVHKSGTWEIGWTDVVGKTSGQQCIYDAKGKLITEGEAAGTPDYRGFSDEIGRTHFKNWPHGAYDLLPFIYDKYLMGDPDKYWMDRRPPNNGNNCPDNDGTEYGPETSDCFNRMKNS